MTNDVHENRDDYGRSIDYLRISVTDRCNLRCRYCMPEDGIDLKDMSDILTLEEIADFARVAARKGIRRIRLTGGEPLVRLGIEDLIADLAAIDGIEDISLTTNGILLPKYASKLKQAGLTRVNISLDTLDPEIYAHVTRCGKLADVRVAIDHAFEAGFDPVKINTVVMRSLHQDLFAFARMSIQQPLHLRFIEYMPVGESSGVHGEGWTEGETVPSDEVIETISQRGEKEGLGPLIPLTGADAPFGSGPARYYAFEGAAGTVGIISPLSNHFCGSCNRLRLTADGKIRPCLFSDVEIDVYAALQSGNSGAIEKAIDDALQVKPESHGQKHGTHRLMSQIGG